MFSSGTPCNISYAITSKRILKVFSKQEDDNFNETGCTTYEIYIYIFLLFPNNYQPGIIK